MRRDRYTYLPLTTDAKTMKPYMHLSADQIGHGYEDFVSTSSTHTYAHTHTHAHTRTHTHAHTHAHTHTHTHTHTHIRTHALAHTKYWHHETFLVQLCERLAIQLYCNCNGYLAFCQPHRPPQQEGAKLSPVCLTGVKTFSALRVWVKTLTRSCHTGVKTLAPLCLTLIGCRERNTLSLIALRK